MQTIWVIENNASSGSIAVELMGDFAVRRIASIASLLRLAQINRDIRPEILLLACTGEDEALLLNVTSLFQGVRVILVGNKWTSNVEPNFEVIRHEFCPFSFVRLLRRERLQVDEVRSGAVHNYRDLELDILAQKVTARSTGEQVALTRKEALVLKAFFARPGSCIGREDLLRDVWDGVRVTDRSIDAQICRLRKLVADFGLSITSVYGQGYILV